MKVLMISTDENILKEGSGVRDRMIEYGKLVEELHIVALTAKNYQFSNLNSQSIINFQISKNTFVYPAFSILKPLCLVKAYKIAKKIIENCKLKTDNCVVTTQDPFETGLVGYLLKKKFKIPLQIQIHTDFLSPYFWKESVKNKIRVLVAKTIIPSADGLRVVSDRIKKSIITQLPNYPITRIAVLPIFIDVEKIRNSPIKTDLHQKYPGKFIILMASRFTREKNINLAIRAVKNLIPNYPNLLLLIVGSGPELRNLKLRVASYKLQDFVVFEAWSDDLASYYKTADLFLLTSNYEGYGRAVIEATAASLPVLMADVGVAVGSVFPVGDKWALARKLEELISSEQLRRSTQKKQSDILKEAPNESEFFRQIQQLWQNCFL